MGAPGSLAISKLVYPETKSSLTTSADVRKIPDSTYNNVIEAITESAIDSAGLIACVALNLLVFICLLSFVNSILKWIGNSLCLNHILSFEYICSYLFWPIAFLIGIDYRDCFKVAELFGIKIFLNEFIAYQKLGTMINNKQIYDAVNWSITTAEQMGDDLVLFGLNKTVLKNGIILIVQLLLQHIFFAVLEILRLLECY
uniref:Slc28a-2 n=1 Tax=Schmidtea mediterranea TaxID=79327 RepID=A0A0H3YFH6_SCHMD|nr:slc28a-2 [Schmidtea mediterranea]